MDVVGHHTVDENVERCRRGVKKKRLDEDVRCRSIAEAGSPAMQRGRREPRVF
jgi:hypothetical protein